MARLAFCLALFASAGLLIAADSEEPPPAVPDWLDAKLVDLPQDKKDFLLSEDAMGFAGTWPKSKSWAGPRS